MPLGLTLVLTVVALGLVIIGSSWYFSWLMRKLLYDKIADLEYVRAYSQPPDRWQRRFLIRSRKRGSIDPEEQRRQTKKNLKRLEKLIAFSETTKFMDSEETRDEVKLVLKLVKREWEDTLTD